MSEITDLRAVLSEVRRRWSRRDRLRAWTVGASAAATILGVGLFAIWILDARGLPLSFVVLLTGALAAATAWAAVLTSRRAPTDRQIARYIEEQAGGLDDVVVTAVEHEAPGPIADVLAADAARAMRDVPLDRIVDRGSLRQALAGALAGSAALLVATVFFTPPLVRGASIAAAYLMPSRVVIEVTPGSARVRAGRPLTITARVRGLDAGVMPVIRVGNEGTPARMQPAATDGEFTFTIDSLDASFDYQVVAGPAQSASYSITAIHPPRVLRVDLQYTYPPGLGLEPRREEESGDIYAPSGTKVGVMITTDKPVVKGQLTLADGSAAPLGGSDTVLTADLKVANDGSYRVGLVDADGLENPGDTEYFIRMLDDRPPDVRILRPAGDKQVTPLEEVLIEARAADDFGVSALELVFQVPGSKDTVVPLGPVTGRTAEGRHQIYLEDLGVAPGDFVSYYARARDIGRGRAPAEARSDIFFLEVKPFEEEFAAAQSQGMSGMQGGSPELQDLAEAQKEIIAATWKLDARATRAKRAGVAVDIAAVAESQSALKDRAEAAASDLTSMMGEPGRRRPGRGVPGATATANPMARAVEAMGRAAGELGRSRTSEALPHEMEALNQLLKADSDVKRRQVARQQGGGGNGNREAPDMSTLFDQELRKKQESNYEMPNAPETRAESDQKDDPLAKIRELARRQEALSHDQENVARSLDRMSADERKRQLERLSREQNELRQQADELSRQMQQRASQRTSSDPQKSQGQQGGQQQSGGQGQSQDAAGSRQLRSISEEMKNAAGDLRREDPQQASTRSSRALDGLRELEQQMQASRPGEQRRAMGDLQLETRQIADAERRLSSEAARTEAGTAGEDARRRLAAEQERLADRTDRLKAAARRMGAQPRGAARNDDPDGTEARQGMAEAARELDRQRVGERMRESADALRQGATPGERVGAGEEMARVLDKIAERMSAASNVGDVEAQHLSDQLARTSELRSRLDELERSIQQLDREAKQAQQGAAPKSDASGRQPGPPSGQTSHTPGRDGASTTQSGGDGGAGGRVERLQRETADKMREARRLARELRDQNPDLRNGPSTPEDWWPSLSAPGTEAFKQDFAKWESLKQHLLQAIERTETQVSARLREKESKERMNAGRHEAVPDAYRELVDKYYQSLAASRKPPR